MYKYTVKSLIQRKECATMHIQVCMMMQKNICILHTQAHTLYGNKSETNQPHGPST